MSTAEGTGYLGAFPLAADAPAVERREFIQKTYFHLTAAIICFGFLTALLLNAPGIEGFVGTVSSGYGPLVLLGVYMLVSHVADRWARSSTSITTQYLGLGLYVAIESAIFVPLLYFAARVGGPSVIPTAAVMTGTIFIGLSALVFITRKDFSFLRGALSIGGLAAMGLIVCGILFGFDLGLFFTVGMIALASGYVLYQTSGVLHHYRVGQHVAASLALFASIALMFWYVIQLVMNRE